MKFSFSLFGRKYIFSAISIVKPSEWTSGMTSRIYGTSMHVLLMDYDIIREDYLLNELTYLQELFKIGNFYVFRTRLEKEAVDEIISGIEYDGSDIGGYHAICLDCFTPHRVIMILRCTGCDYSFINAPSYNPEKHWVLRFDSKGNREPPEFLTVVESPYEGVNLQSTFHSRLIDDIYDLDIEKTLSNPDGNEFGIIDHYDTAKRVKE